MEVKSNILKNQIFGIDGKEILELLTILILLIISLLAVVLPNFRKVITVKKTISEIKEETEFLQNKLTLLNQAKSAYPHYEELMVASSQRVPQDPQVLELLQGFVLKASSNGISLGVINYLPRTAASRVTAKTKTRDTEVEGVNVYAFNLNGIGTYSDIKRFIGSLEQGDREIRINNVDLGRVSVDLYQLSFSIAGQAFWK